MERLLSLAHGVCSTSICLCVAVGGGRERGEEDNEATQEPAAVEGGDASCPVPQTPRA